jgi:hypothetical protein
LHIKRPLVSRFSVFTRLKVGSYLKAILNGIQSLILFTSFQAAAGALKRKSISFQDSNAGSKVSKTGGAGKPVSAPAGKPYSGAPRKGTSLYAPPQGKYSKNVGQFGKFLFVSKIGNTIKTYSPPPPSPPQYLDAL